MMILIQILSKSSEGSIIYKRMIKKHIVTNNHIIKWRYNSRCRLSDGTKTWKIVRQCFSMCLIKIFSRKVMCEFGDSSKLCGETLLLLFGSPLGIDMQILLLKVSPPHLPTYLWFRRVGHTWLDGWLKAGQPIASPACEKRFCRETR